MYDLVAEYLADEMRDECYDIDELYDRAIDHIAEFQPDLVESEIFQLADRIMELI